MTSIALMCGATLWIPPGPAQVDHLMLPLLLFPAIWAVLFFHACLDRRLGRAYAVQIALLVSQSALVLPKIL